MYPLPPGHLEFLTDNLKLKEPTVPSLKVTTTSSYSSALYLTIYLGSRIRNQTLSLKPPSFACSSTSRYHQVPLNLSQITQITCILNVIFLSQAWICNLECEQTPNCCLSLVLFQPVIRSP